MEASGTQRWTWVRLASVLAALVILLSAGAYLVDRHALRKWLRSFGADPNVHPYAFFATRLSKGMDRDDAERLMPPATRIERYVIQEAGGDSTLLERYVYPLVITDLPVDVYYDDNNKVEDFYAGDNPGLGVAPRRLTASEAFKWGRPGR